MSDYVLSATLELKDKLTAKLNDARKGLSGVKSSASDASGALDRVGTSAVKAAADTGRLKSALSGVKSKDITLRVKDEATSTARRIQSAMQTITSKQATVSVRDEASPRITHIKEELAGLSGKAYTTLVNVRTNTPAALGGIKSKLSGVASGMLMNTSVQMAGAAGIGFGIYDAIKSYADFEKEMSAVKAISGATGAEFDMLTEKARQMGADTKFSATESAQAFEYMAMAGWKTEDMMNGIDGVMNLAAASGEDLGRVSDIVTDALTAFGLKASDSSHFADVLAAAATSSNTNVGMMGETFKYVAPLAGALGYNVEDVATAIGVMANSGVKASEAGTSLRSIFTRLAKPPADAQKALDALGISITNADGTIKPFMQTMTELRAKFAGLTKEQKIQYASSIAGQEAMSGLLAIMNASEGDFDKVADAINHADGAAKKAAQTRMDNLAGDIELVGGAWDQLVQTIMKGSASGGLRKFVQEVGSLLDFLNERVKDGLDFGDIFALVGKGITDLKNKFLEFDGVGSILAGGALAAGLYKIIGLTRKAISAVKSLSGIRRGGASGGSAASSVGEMVVQAGTVIVNGQSVAGGGTGKGSPTGSSGTRGGVVTTRGLRANAGLIAGGGLISAAFGAMDVYSTKNQNAELLEEAASGVKQASNSLEELAENGGSGEQWKSALDEYTKANDYHAQVEHDNRVREGDAIGGAIGSTAGTVIGGAIGSLVGPAGTMIGMTAGGIIGEVAGKHIGSWLADYNIQNTVSLEKIAQWLKPPEKAPIGFDENGKTVPVDIVGDSIGIKDTTKDPENFFGVQTDFTKIGPNPYSSAPPTSDVDLSVSPELDVSGMQDDLAALSASAQQSADTSAEAFSEAGASILTDFATTSESAGVTADDIQMDLLNSAQGSQDAWSPFPSWYDSSVASPTESSASQCGADMSSSFAASASSTQSSWSGVGGFFAGLFASIKSGAASCAASVAASMASAAESARAGGHTTIAAGLDWIGNNAAWLAGTSYPHDASGTSFAPGGWTEVNEHGGEIIDLPTGARVYPHATTVSMLKDMFSGATVEPQMSAVEPIATMKPLVEPQMSTTGLTELSGIGDMLSQNFKALQTAPEMPSINEMDNLPPITPQQMPNITVTAPAKASGNGSVNVTITGNTFAVREEADIDRIAYKLLELMRQSYSNINPMEGAFA